MTRGEMRSRVRFFIDEPVQANFNDADINNALNLAQLHVQLEIVKANEGYFEAPEPATIQLVPDVERYPLHVDTNGECDVLRVKRVEYASSGRSIYPTDVNQNDGGFYLVGNNMGFKPRPQAAEVVNYWYVPMLPDMTADTERSEIPRVLHDMLPVRAAIDSFVKDQETIGQLQLLWDRYLELLRSTVADRQIMEPKRVRRVEDW